MKVLNWIAYACWALAAIALVLSFMDEYAFSFLFGLAGSLAVSGVLFFAFSKVIFLLTDIRDALVTDTTAPQKTISQNAEVKVPTRSLEEISADLKKMKSNL